MLSKKMRFFKIFLLLLLGVNFLFALPYEEIKEAYAKSYLYEKVGDYKDAIRVLMPVYNAYPDSYTVNLRLGWLYYLMGKYANSVYHYKKADSAIPSSVESKLGLSLPLIAQERWGEAEQVLYRVLAIDYYNYYGNLRLAKVLGEEGKYKQQIAVALKMLNIYPTAVPFLVFLGSGYYHLGNLKRAEEIFKNVLVLDPENITAKGYLEKIEKSSKGEKAQESPKGKEED